MKALSALNLFGIFQQIPYCWNFIVNEATYYVIVHIYSVLRAFRNMKNAVLLSVSNGNMTFDPLSQTWLQLVSMYKSIILIVPDLITVSVHV